MDTSDIPHDLLQLWLRRECGQILGMAWPDEATLETADEWEDEPHGARVLQLLRKVATQPRSAAGYLFIALEDEEWRAAKARLSAMVEEHCAIESPGRHEGKAEWALLQRREG